MNNSGSGVSIEGKPITEKVVDSSSVDDADPDAKVELPTASLEVQTDAPAPSERSRARGLNVGGCQQPIEDKDNWNNGDKPKLGAAEAHLGRKLADHYRLLLEAPVPERFMQLLAELERTSEEGTD
jgi:hypothetical protein